MKKVDCDKKIAILAKSEMISDLALRGSNFQLKHTGDSDGEVKAYWRFR